jgi:hypothetical protein
MDLIIRVKVNNKVDAYRLVNSINFDHEVVSINFDGEDYVFDKVNQPKYLFNEKYVDEKGKEIKGNLI